MKYEIEFASNGSGGISATVGDTTLGLYFETDYCESKAKAVKELEQWIRGDVSMNDDGEYFVTMKDATQHNKKEE